MTFFISENLLEAQDIMLQQLSQLLVVQLYSVHIIPTQALRCANEKIYIILFTCFYNIWLLLFFVLILLVNWYVLNWLELL